MVIEIERRIAMSARAPNILLVMSDQEQHWSLMPDGLTRPGLEWLLERGVGFSAHHVVTLPCGPSRSTIYTGRHTPHTKVVTNPSRSRFPGMSAQVPTIGTMLREHGYYTAYKGKWHVSVIDPPERFSASTAGALEAYGFAEYTADGDPVGIAWDGYRQDPAIASDAANWLLGNSGGKPTDQPWFLAVNFVNPHDVMFFDATGHMNDVSDGGMSGGMRERRLPAPVDAIYQRDWDVPLPATFDDELGTKPAAQRLAAERIGAMLGHIPHDDQQSWHALRSYYYNCLTDLDRNVHTLLLALQASGHDRDTVIVYSTDHGEAAGAHGLRGKPTSLYREVINVPLVIAHPDGARGASTGALSSATDLAPTMLALAGLEPGERHPDLRGHDLSAVVADPAARTARDEAGVLLCMSGLPGPTGAAPAPRLFLRGIVDGRWKFGRYFSHDDHHNPREWAELSARNDLELYDTATDPGERTNLARDPEHRQTLVALAGRLATLVEAEVGTDDGRELIDVTAAPAAGAARN
jgi:arylsulfatase